MEHYSLLLLLLCMVLSINAWSAPFFPARGYPVHRTPHRFIRHVRNTHVPHPFRIPVQAIPVREATEETEPQRQRPKRDHDFEFDHEHHHGDRDHSRGVTGPVHTFVKTDKNANYKWGVRHHVGNKFAS